MDFDPNSRHLAPSEMIFLLVFILGILYGGAHVLFSFPWILWLVLGMFAVYGLYGGIKVARRMFVWLKKD